MVMSCFMTMIKRCYWEMRKLMTRKELEIRETAVLSGYRDCNAEKCVDYVMKLYERNVNKKLYRFRPPQKHDIEALLKSQIYLCRPRVYTDNNDCVWIDDIQALVEYEINVLNKKSMRYTMVFLHKENMKKS